MFVTVDYGAGYSTGPRLFRVLKAIADNFGLLEPAVRTSAAADYQPAIGDRVIRRTRVTAQTVTIAPNATVAFNIGHQILVEQSAAGALTLVAGAGVTINLIATKTLVLAGQWGVARLIKTGTNEWSASGDLTAAA